MNDSKVLHEISKNERIVEHDDWGKFLLKRPTNHILSMIETARTKSLNRDLQTKETVVDPDTGEKKHVPAFLTRRSKAKILKEHGEWTEEDENEIDEAQQKYREVCIELDQAGFEGADAMMKEYNTLLQYLKDTLGDNYEEVKKEVGILIPVRDQVESDEAIESEDELPDPEGDYLDAKKALEDALQDMEAISKLDRLDELHKQYNLFLKGVQAQSELYVAKIREISLFSDTVESRADKTARIAKVFHCVRDPETKERVWDSVYECEQSDPDKLSWLLAEVEKFERLDPRENEEEHQKKFRFNFLFPSDDMFQSSDDSHVRRTSKQDGELQETS